MHRIVVGVVAASACAATAWADTYNVTANLSGLHEVPPNASPAFGSLSGSYDDATNTLNFNLSFSGLLAPATAAHFHGAAPAGTNAPVQIGFAGFPSTTSGNYPNTYVLTATQETQLLAGLWYVNVHTSVFPGGEIRDQLSLERVPAPGAAGLLGLGALAMTRRRRR